MPPPNADAMAAPEAAIKGISGYFRSGTSELGRDFFGPCLGACSLYRRAVGYFSSTALNAWASALPHVILNDITIHLLISPAPLSPEDFRALQQATDPVELRRLQQQLAGDFLFKALDFASNPNNDELRAQLLAWLIAHEKLILKFAYATHVEEPGIYHEKIGVFDFPSGAQVAFIGSANETLSGHARNYESVHVYRSWLTADIERVVNIEADFERAWSNTAEGLSVVPLSGETLRQVQVRAPDAPPNRQTARPSHSGPEAAGGKGDTAMWRHQDEAMDAFIESRRGVLEMATGTGKTRTALKILSELTKRDLIRGFIITTDGTDLLDQWYEELLGWTVAQSESFAILRQYDHHHQAGSFILESDHAALLISRHQLHKVLTKLGPQRSRRIAIVHDEVHGFGSETNLTMLAGTHADYTYRLGLSATPEREYDADGTAFITEEVGPVIYRFGLEEAIRRGILCEFNYVALHYELTESDKQRLHQVYVRKAARAHEGRPMSEQELWIELSKVYKTAEQKPTIFDEYIAQHPTAIKNAIIFVETREYGERLLPLLHKYTHLYRTYYAADDAQNLKAFANGKIDCLITCHKLSQGIDIQRLETVALLSSARARLETIQRIGRCLRRDPNNPTKRATVIDFIRVDETEGPSESADSARFEWLSNLSKVRRIG